ncbi:MAG: hypothetical protein ACLGIV_00020 [Actinomycetes bacterium]
MSALTVRGGAGSLVARFEDMARVAAVLDDVGDGLRSLSASTVACAGDGDLLAGGVLSAGTLARATAQILDAATGPSGLLVVAVQIEATALWVRTTITVYQAVDAAQAALLEGMQDVAGFALGLGVWGVLGAGVVVTGGAVVAGGAAAPSVVLAAVLRHGSQEALTLVHDALAGRLSWAELPARLAEFRGDALVAGGLAALAPLVPGAQAWLAEFGGTVGDVALDTLFEQPWVTDVLTGGAEGLIAGLSAPVMLVDAVTPGALVPPGWPPATYEEAVAALIAAGRLRGAFDDRTAVATPLPAHESRDAVLPDGIAGIFEGQDQIATPVDGAARVRVIQLRQPDGSSAWMVQVPGTQVWDPVAGPNPADVTTNLHLMAQERTATSGRRSTRRWRRRVRGEASR